jgi:hypothetical protein
MAHLLVVLTGSVSREQLEEAIGPDVADTSVYVVAPSRVGPLEWLATDEGRARGEAAARVLEAEWLLAGTSEVGGEAGEADAAVAVADALKHFPADEIVLVGDGSVDAGLLASLRALGPPVRLSGVALEPTSLRTRARAGLRGLTSGRSAATPLAAFVAANVGLLVIALLGSLLAALIVWLVESS